MRAVDPSLRLVGVGGSGRSQDDGQAPGHDHDIPASVWNPGVLSVAGTEMDALSVHWYFPGLIGRPLDESEADYLQMASAPDLLEAALRTTLGQISEVLGEGSPLPISLDEWNRMVEFEDHFSCNHRLVDAVFFAGCFNVLLRHADRVTVALLAQLVNCLAPIQTATGGCFVTAAHLVAALYAEFGRGDAVRVMVDTPDMDVPPMENLEAAVWEPDAAVRAPRRSPLLDAAATRGALGTSVFLVNRSRRDALPVLVRGPAPGGSGRFRYLHGDGPFAANSLENPTALGYRESSVDIDDRGETTIEVPPHTVGVAVLR